MKNRVLGKKGTFFLLFFFSFGGGIKKQFPNLLKKYNVSNDIDSDILDVVKMNFRI